jgi:4-amino-4-deoxy-L-arabinose transferase-like glycosyltransferase
MSTGNPKIQTERSITRITILLIVLHIAVAIPLAWILNIWADEASTLYTTQNGFLNAFQHALADEKQAPLYFWLLSLWRGIDGSIFFARLFSILCSAIAIKFLFDLAQRLFTRNAAIFVAAVFALHPFLIWASLEIRVYSFVVLLSVLLLKFFEDGFLDGDERKKARVLFLVFSIVGLYTSYYIGFLLVGCFVAVLVTRRWKAAKNYILLMVVAGLAFLPLLQAIRAQFARDSASFHGAATLAEGLQIIWNFVLTFVLPTEIFTPEDQTSISVVRLWIVRLAIIGTVFLLIKNRKRIDDQLLAYGAIAAVISGFLLLSYFLLGDVYVQIRHSAVLFAPVILVTALVINRIAFTKEADGVKRFRSFLVPGALALLLLGFFSYSVYSLYPNLTKRGDWERVAAFIKGKEKPGQPIVIFTTFDALALPYYYRGENKILPDEKYFAWEPEAAFGTEASHKKQTDFVISEIPPGAGEVWLIVNEKCLAREACLPLENYVKSNYTIVEEKEFYLEKVFLLRRKPQ